ncbi:SpoIID/LytB domain-containing protein [Lachnospiraceae bacterium OttesenSCG-928-D06]|nr:SpoIID/LytB domain-containing protein [Lachnospiraceae bacterium OttesenSCG-928-D06]
MNRNQWNLNKSQRIQMKAFACILGIILLLVLLIGKLFFLNPKEEKEAEEIHIPVVTLIENAWIISYDEAGINIFVDGIEESYPLFVTGTGEEAVPMAVPQNAREQIADITLTDGMVTEIIVKDNKINGKVLSVSEDKILLEEYGEIAISDKAKVYRLYDELQMSSISDIAIGYNFCDFVMENHKVVGILCCKQEAMEYIRVLIKSSNYGSNYHKELVVSSDTDYVIRYGSFDHMIEEVHEAFSEVSITVDSEYFSGDRIYIEPVVLTGKVVLQNVNRSQGIPYYRGTIEILKSSEEFVVINEVLLEEYLYSVVPSEMPASYPEEALKAQAICARTYAYSHMIKASYQALGAHVDDSAGYQVYNNILEHESTTKAAKATFGQLLYTKDEETLAGTYYYSTSCGMGSDIHVWKSGNTEGMEYLRSRSISQPVMAEVLANTSEDMELKGEAMKEEDAFAAYIQSINETDFERNEGWYRWTYTVLDIDVEKMLSIIKKRYETNPKLVLTLAKNGEYVSEEIKKFDYIQGMTVVKRGSGGVADELLIETNKGTIKIITEHNIRYVLNSGVDKVIRQDASEISSPNLLPSAFFIINPVTEDGKVTGYTLIGGGFGHGVGMSQNAARAMANAGYDSREILTFFYENCMLKQVYENENNP